MDKPSVSPVPTTELPINNQTAPPPAQPPFKKYLPFLFIGMGILGIVIIMIAIIFRPSAKKQPPKSKIVEAVNTVPVSDRPYVTLEPTDSGSDNLDHKDHPIGTEVMVKVHTVTLSATEADYELEYQAGSLLQAAIGNINLTVEQLPANRNLLLGSCSAGGKCSYNQNVSGGTLLLRLKGGSQKFAVKGEWTYQLMAEREGKFSSRDSKFRVDVGTKGLPSSTYVIVMQPMGLPQPIEGEIVAGPYHISAGETSIKSAEVTMIVPANTTQESTESNPMKLLGWTGSSWKEYKSTIADQALTATVDGLTTLVVVK